jgi:hypothetical protein
LRLRHGHHRSITKHRMTIGCHVPASPLARFPLLGRSDG